MNNMFVIQDKDGYVVAAAYEESEAYRVCIELQKSNKLGIYSYRSVPFFKSEGCEIHVIAAPINLKLV